MSAAALAAQEASIYELITRRFLACCSEDAKGHTTTVEILYGEETFNASGLVVLERNYLDVYWYENWHSSTMLPVFTLGETFMPTEAMMNEGGTTAPNYLTESDLIALMDANGIGTDATMAEHIQRIQEREYVEVRQSGGGNANNNAVAPAARGGRGGARGGRGGGRGGAAGGGKFSNYTFFHVLL